MPKSYKSDAMDSEMIANRMVTRSMSRAKKLKLTREQNYPVAIQGCSKERLKETALSEKEGLNLFSLPLEIHLEIFRHLSSEDLQTLRRVCKHFGEIALHPSLWTELEISKYGRDTKDVIDDLKRMTMLKKIHMKDRADVNDILKQISRSSTHLEQLVISYPESPAGTWRYLDSTSTRRIVERCPRLHTLNVSDSRFLGLRLFRSLGRAGARLRVFRAKLRPGQLETFVRHMEHVTPGSRDLVADLCASRPPRFWSTVIYHVNEGASVICLRQKILTFKQSD